MFDAEYLVKKAIEKHREGVAVACSFGKDSIVVLHMALKYDKNVKVIFGNTGVEFPETIQYKNMIKEKWNLNLIETKPYKDMTLWKCIEKYGLPEKRSTKSKYHSPRCCYYLKEKPAMVAYKEHKIIAVITGLMKCESRNRALLITKMDNGNDEKNDIVFCGQRYFAKSWNVWKYHPIAYWSEKDVWEYIKEHNISINPVYTKWNGVYKRCGCLPCTAYIGWEHKLSKTHPKLCQLLKEKQVSQREAFIPLA